MTFSREIKSLPLHSFRQAILRRSLFRFLRILALSIGSLVLFLAGAGAVMISMNAFQAIEALRLPGLAFLAALCSFAFSWYAAKMSKHTPRSFVHEADVIQKGSIDEYIDAELQELLVAAYDYAKKAHHASVTSSHLFLALLGAASTRTAFARLELAFDDVKAPMQRHFLAYERGAIKSDKALLSALRTAVAKAIEAGKPHITSIDLFLAVYEENAFLKELFYGLDIEEHEVQAELEWLQNEEAFLARRAEFKRLSALKPTGTMNRAYTALATPLLDSLSEDLTAKAARGQLPLLIGRKNELELALQVMRAQAKQVLFIGDDGAGKGMLISGIAERMVEEHVPDRLKDKRLVRIAASDLLAGDGAASSDRLRYLFQEIAHAGNIVLAIDHIEYLLEDSELAAALRSELEGQSIPVFATTSPEAYGRFIERGGFASVFEPVRIEEPEQSEALAIVQSYIPGIESKYHVFFTVGAILTLYDYTNRYLRGSAMPARMIDAAKEIAASKSGKASAWNRITEADIAAYITSKTDIPLSSASGAEKHVLLGLEDLMEERVIGQNEAITLVAKALRRARAELRPESRPIANFLFLGPTGVGKTELAKTTSETFFGDEDRMLRFDMSEYQDIQALDRLIGTRDGGGQLTEAVREHPFALLLLDELEKAHPDILNIFLQVMDDGRLTDGLGQTIDFTNIILIATSNAGSDYIFDAVRQGISSDDIKLHLIEEELQTVYRPEFLNRFDDIIVFKPLSEEHVEAIARLLLAHVEKKLALKGISFTYAQEILKQLARKGYDPKFGARPLRRIIQNDIEAPLADILLSKDVARRDTLHVNASGEIEHIPAKTL
jgi:ATP-dependent Clp protease ATP-binding subunit ClpC